MDNPVPNAKPFVKGDPRINRNGRPKTFDAFRTLAQAISHEEAKKSDENNPKNKVPMVIDGHKVTVAEAILRQWAQSRDARLQMAFVEFAFGKPPTKTELTGKDAGPIELVVSYAEKKPSAD